MSTVVKIVFSVLFSFIFVASAQRGYVAPGLTLFRVAFWALVAYLLLTGVVRARRFWLARREAAGNIARGAWRRTRTKVASALSTLEQEGRK